MRPQRPHGITEAGKAESPRDRLGPGNPEQVTSTVGKRAIASSPCPDHHQDPYLRSKFEWKERGAQLSSLRGSVGPAHQKYRQFSSLFFKVL